MFHIPATPWSIQPSNDTYMTQALVATATLDCDFVHVLGGGFGLHPYDGVTSLMDGGCPVHLLIRCPCLLLCTCNKR